ncbi:putative phage abortive infection protein [Aliarcobacter butzleri]|uniref:putative phage abortive infection protein n=1 Tax=Aliarcobacter butzleri TaxID=28197 RepID=UPI00263C8479|nr:putative phage abortive infection protein [Aliarcobacter butzleri]MDN5049792.1 hypothetical protein [Aliarcobacter butzleri]MDN5056891.1 hypothetical protein [Aliarcobacter butzleri]
MEEEKENLDNTNQCKSIYIILKEFGINIYKKIKPIAKEWWGIIFIAFIAMLTIFIFGYFYFSKHSLSWLSGEIEELGQMGDFFGGTLNPILAFLSFCLLLITIKLQSKELKNSTKELAKSSKALKKQSKSLKIQNFESTFFNMLNLYFSLKNRLNQNPPEIRNIEYKIDEDDIDYIFETKKYERNIVSVEEGIPRLAYILTLFLNKTNRFPKEFRNKPIEKIEEEIKLKYKENQLSDTNSLYLYFASIYGKHLNHLMRTIYHIINFVDKNDDIKNKKFYINLLRSQIDTNESILIFYNAISKHGKNLLPLVIKYEFFEHLVYNKFICRPTLKLYIEKTIQLNKKFPINKAFGENYNYEKLLKKLYEETNTSSQEQQ